MLKPLPIALGIASLAALSACNPLSRATPEERVGYLRELVRVRTIARDTLPIDGCSVNRFMEGVPAWRDSLVSSERSMIVDVLPCEVAGEHDGEPVPGRFVLTAWHRNWSGEYMIRGSTMAFDLGYRFTDGVFVGRERLDSQAFFAGSGERSIVDSTALPVGDSTRLGGTVADTPGSDTLPRDSTRTRP